MNVKLPYLREWNESRYRRACRYRELLAGAGDLRFQHESKSSTHVYHLFVIETEHRDGLQRHMEDRGIQTGVHYPTPIHLQDAYRDLGHGENDFPVSEGLAKRMLSLPMFPELTEEEIVNVAQTVRAFYE